MKGVKRNPFTKMYLVTASVYQSILNKVPQEYVSILRELNNETEGNRERSASDNLIQEMSERDMNPNAERIRPPGLKRKTNSGLEEDDDDFPPPKIYKFGENGPMRTPDGERVEHENSEINIDDLSFGEKRKRLIDPLEDRRKRKLFKNTPDGEINSNQFLQPLPVGDQGVNQFLQPLPNIHPPVFHKTNRKITFDSDEEDDIPIQSSSRLQDPLFFNRKNKYHRRKNFDPQMPVQPPIFKNGKYYVHPGDAEECWVTGKEDMPYCCLKNGGITCQNHSNKTPLPITYQTDLVEENIPPMVNPLNEDDVVMDEPPPRTNIEGEILTAPQYVPKLPLKSCVNTANISSIITRTQLIPPQPQPLSSKPFPCPFCNKSFQQKWYRRVHMKKVHPEEYRRSFHENEEEIRNQPDRNIFQNQIGGKTFRKWF